MELIKNLLNLIFLYFESRRKAKIEKEERERVVIEQQEKTAEMVINRKKETVKPSTDDNFFGD